MPLRGSAGTKTLPLDLWEITEAVIAVGSACEVLRGLSPTPPGKCGPAELICNHLEWQTHRSVQILFFFASSTEHIIDLQEDRIPK